VHQERPDNKAKTLAIANLLIVETESLEDLAEHSLSIAVLLSKHVDIGETSSYIFPNKSIIGARFGRESLVLRVQERVMRASNARPDDPSKRCWNTAANLVGCERGKSLSRL
jgi:hypothetical protein